MPAPRTPRQRARAQLTTDIKRLALEQLATAGAAGLSLRGIARDLGMVSSAIYRYFPSRDDLLTQLLVDAYGDLADALAAAQDRLADEAHLPSDEHRRRWVVTATAMRAWAVENRHRFSLLYGTPVPGYAAPADTIVPAERVMRSFFGVVDDAARSGRFESVPVMADGGSPVVGQLTAAAALLGPAVPPEVMARAIAGLAQVVGMISLELGGHFVGGFEPADALFEHTTRRLADSLGL